MSHADGLSGMRRTWLFDDRDDGGAEIFSFPRAISPSAFFANTTRITRSTPPTPATPRSGSLGKWKEKAWARLKVRR